MHLSQDKYAKIKPVIREYTEKGVEMFMQKYGLFQIE